MKHSPDSTRELAQTITGFVSAAGILADPDRVVRLAELLAWLAPAAARIGLTKYADARGLFEQLVAPALLLLRPDLRSAYAGPAMDFGAGSGAVGLSFATMVTDAELVLADRRARVVQFLDVAVSRFSLSNCRAAITDLACPSTEETGAYACILIRAFAEPTGALAVARPWLRDGGTIALWHQPNVSPTPDGFTMVRTEPTNLRSLALSIYQRT